MFTSINKYNLKKNKIFIIFYITLLTYIIYLLYKKLIIILRKKKF